MKIQGKDILSISENSCSFTTSVNLKTTHENTCNRKKPSLLTFITVSNNYNKYHIPLYINERANSKSEEAYHKKEDIDFGPIHFLH